MARVVRLDIFTEEGRLTDRYAGDGVVRLHAHRLHGLFHGGGRPHRGADGPESADHARSAPTRPAPRSYVLSPEHVITIEAADANRKFVYLSADGGKAFSLKNGDQVRVRQSKFAMRAGAAVSKKSFCEILDYKMTEAAKP